MSSGPGPLYRCNVPLRSIYDKDYKTPNRVSKEVRKSFINKPYSTEKGGVGYFD